MKKPDPMGCNIQIDTGVSHRKLLILLRPLGRCEKYQP